MEPKEVEAQLIKVLRQIQKDSGYEGQPIDGKTFPVNDLEGFDSLLWPVAICMLEAKLKANQKIPDGINIFFDDSNHPLSISESARFVCEIVSSKENE